MVSCVFFSSFQMGVVIFANQATIQFNLNSYNNSQDVIDQIDLIPFKDQETNTSGGKQMQNILLRKLMIYYFIIVILYVQ